MSQQSLTMQETMQIHELLNFKTICMTKSKLIQGVVFDQELKCLLEIHNSTVNNLQSLLNKTQPQ
jgi:similar to spore coat protein